jgi:hypothetical protein
VRAEKSILWKREFLRCSGPSASRLHQICLGLSDNEYTMYFVNGDKSGTFVEVRLLSGKKNPIEIEIDRYSLT